MLSRVNYLLVVTVMISLTACSTVVVKNDGDKVSATITKPMLSDMHESISTVAQETKDTLLDICRLNLGIDKNAKIRKKNGAGEEKTFDPFTAAATAATVLETLNKMLPSLSYSAAVECGSQGSNVEASRALFEAMSKKQNEMCEEINAIPEKTIDACKSSAEQPPLPN